MRRIIGIFVPAYWMAFFGLLALAAMAEATGEVFAIFQALSFPGGFLGNEIPAGPVLSTALAFGFSLTSVLFLWMIVTAIAQIRGSQRESDEIARTAFGVATAMMTVLLAIGAIFLVRGLFASASLQLLALLVSYMALQAEQRRTADAPREVGDAAEITARLMAIGAAHNSMLTRFSRRPGNRNEAF
ncbi:hypothetical protein [Aquibium oceanicum]|uniref:Uncharacterized protein n=1 Tax=Aquibium oceanicum TaxID=1670800 RepID=A0A1L3SSW1_9HYPH|nr:hypothetical protein [Aquibium oceanicum]APH72507.1 hypothetical protein BSQ44_14925 [Aquibium oceanicum]